jgi:hypothetical protein
MKNRSAKCRDLGNAVPVPEHIRDDFISKYGASSSGSGLSIPIPLSDAEYQEYAARYTGLSVTNVPLRIALDRFMGSVVRDEPPPPPLNQILKNDTKGPTSPLATLKELFLKQFKRDIFAEIPVVQYYTIAPQVSDDLSISETFT